MSKHRKLLSTSFFLLLALGIWASKSEALAKTSTPYVSATMTYIATLTPTPSNTPTFTPSPSSTPTLTPTFTPTQTQTPIPLPIPTKIKDKIFFSIRTSTDIFELAIFFGGIAITVLSTASLQNRPNRFTIATFPAQISEWQRDNTILVSLPSLRRSSERERVYFFVRFGNKVLPASVRQTNSAPKRHMFLKNSDFPLWVHATLQMGDEIVGKSDSEYYGFGNEFPLIFISPPARHYRWKFTIEFEPNSGGPHQEMVFDSNITVTQFFGLTGAQVALYNLLGVILGLVLAYLGIVLRTQ
jgi:hypothetical protein